ncbi:MAG: cell division protein FtsZ [Candidatus Saccharimonadales bacterium]
MPEVVPNVETFARIKVMGVGGGAGSALNRMVESGIDNVEFVAVNADAQALDNSLATTKLHIGRDTTGGLGAGADPSVGATAAQESREEIAAELKDVDMVFVTTCMGGGTASGAGPIVAEVAREMGVLTVGFATRPFAFEGERRRANADGAIERLRKNVDTLITIPNDRLLQTVDRSTSVLDSFAVVDDVLRQGVKGISDLITVHGLINLDFADVRAIMHNAGSALMGIGQAGGEDRAVVAAKQAIESPLLEVSIDGARGVLFNVTGGRDMSMHEINEAAEVITAAVDPEANIIFGATLDESLDGDLKITVIATGFDIPDPRGGLGYFSRPDDGRISDEDMISGSLDLDGDDTASDTGIEETSEDKDRAVSEAVSNAWDFNETEEDFDVPAFVRKRKSIKDRFSKKSQDEDESESDSEKETDKDDQK